MASLEIQERQEGGRVRLLLIGELGLDAAPILNHRLEELQGQGQLVCLDLSGLQFVNSSGIQPLVNALTDARANGSRLEIHGRLPPRVEHSLRLTRLEHVMTGHQGMERMSHKARPTDLLPRTPFDRALELQALGQAADAYAARHGEAGSASYRTAWLAFRQRIQSMRDLRRWRASASGRPPPPQEHAPPKPRSPRIAPVVHGDHASRVRCG